VADGSKQANRAPALIRNPVRSHRSRSAGEAKATRFEISTLTLFNPFYMEKSENGHRNAVAEMFGHKSRNYEEDFYHENGFYVNICIACNNKFMGHKRRVICKKCGSNSQTEALKKTE
jgi:hypothetical protein